MNQRRDSEKEVAEVVRLLAPLAAAQVELPSSDTVYWRAQARLALEQARRRQSKALRPLRLFHRTIGVGAIAVAALVSISPLFLRGAPDAELLAVPLLIAMVTVGAHLLAEAGPA
jgi:hypothetical protein